jgi:two-component system cell cycle sensor histidine kinase/response regulator CckA
VTPLRGANVGAVVTHTNITDRRRAEGAIQQVRRRLESVIDSATDGIITIDAKQRIIVFNAAAERIFGWQAADILGQPLELLIPQRLRDRHGQHVISFGRTDIHHKRMAGLAAVPGLRADGAEFFLEASISQVEVEGQKLLTVTCQDITERQQAEQARGVLESQLRQAQKMEAVGQLAGGVAHDFNNLLTVILGYSEILLTTLSAEHPMHDCVEDIREAGSRAASLTRQLLILGRKSDHLPVVLDVHQAIRDMENLLRRLIGEDMLLTIQLGNAVGPVRIDPGLLGQVLLNLAVNARDAMPQGGTLTIETGHVELAPTRTPTNPDRPPGRYAVISVSDTGCGMPAEVMSRVFEPFFTTKPVGKGTGLGLSVVHGIVKQAAGHIDVESQPGQGSTFRIHFPVVDPLSVVDPPLRMPPEPDAGQVRGGRETILLVEDDEGVSRLMSHILRSHGYETLVARNGKHALQIAENHREKIDLVLTDVVMPHMSGRELATKLLARSPQTRILYMSGHMEDAILRQGLVQGKVSFVQKPVAPDALARHVRDVLDSPI